MRILQNEVHVYSELRGPELLGELEPPPAAVIQWHIPNTYIVGWQLKRASVQSADVIPPKLSGEVSELKDDVLPSARLLLRRSGVAATEVIWRQQDDRKVHIRVVLKLLDDRAAASRLFMENDCSDAEPFEESGHRFPSCVVVPVDDKDAVGVRPWRSRRGLFDMGRDWDQLETLFQGLKPMDLLRYVPLEIFQSLGWGWQTGAHHSDPPPRVLFRELGGCEQTGEELVVVATPSAVLALRGLDLLDGAELAADDGAPLFDAFRDAVISLLAGDSKFRVGGRRSRRGFAWHDEECSRTDVSG